MKKQCSNCKRFKDPKFFARNNSKPDKLQGECKACKQERDRNYYHGDKTRKDAVISRRELSRQRNRDIILEHLQTHPCVDCGETDILVLEFDHVRGVKTSDVVLMVVHGYGEKTLREEIEKCDIRCANCHKRKTYKGSWRDNIRDSSNGRTPGSDPVNGSSTLSSRTVASEIG